MADVMPVSMVWKMMVAAACLVWWLASAAAAQVTTEQGTAGGGATVAAATQPAAADDNNGGGAGSPQLVTGGLDAQGAMRLMASRTGVLTATRPITRISVSDPAVADVTTLDRTHVLVTGKKAGAAEIRVWDDRDVPQTIPVQVASDLAPLQEQYKRLFPGLKIDATIAEDNVVLSGRVPDLHVAEQAAQLAGPYGKKVVNLLEISGGQQVMLQVRFAEVSKSATSQLGVNLAYSDGSSFAASNIGNQTFGIRALAANPDASGLATATTSNITQFGRAQIGSTSLAYFVQAMRQNDLLRILAEPNLIATSGEEASFLAGGEFPIPVTQNTAVGNGSAAITIEYREFGVRLTFVPVVLGDGQIRLKVQPEVSDLDFTTAVTLNGFVVPGLTTRRLSTTVQLGEGQTLALAGLLNNTVAASKSVTPLLGDLPVLGTLFRSVRYNRRETELVVLVTPRLVAPMDPDDVAAVPGERWRHPNEGQLFLNQDLGGPVPDGKTRTYLGRPGLAPAPETAGGTK